MNVVLPEEHTECDAAGDGGGGRRRRAQRATLRARAVFVDRVFFAHLVAAKRAGPLRVQMPPLLVLDAVLLLGVAGRLSRLLAAARPAATATSTAASTASAASAAIAARVVPTASLQLFRQAGGQQWASVEAPAAAPAPRRTATGRHAAKIVCVQVVVVSVLDRGCVNAESNVRETRYHIQSVGGQVISGAASLGQRNSAPSTASTAAAGGGSGDGALQQQNKARAEQKRCVTHNTVRHAMVSWTSVIS